MIGDNPKVGDPVWALYRTEEQTYYRKMRVIRITPSTFIVKTPAGNEHRFWRQDRHEIGGKLWATFEQPEGERFVEQRA